MQQTPLSTAKYELMHLRYLISGCSDMSRLGICSGLGEMPSHPQRLSRRESPPFFLCHSSTQYVPHSVALLYQGVGSFLRSSFHSPSESILGTHLGAWTKSAHYSQFAPRPETVATAGHPNSGQRCLF